VPSADRLCGVIALAVAVTTAIGARKLIIFSNGIPGPGLVPFMAAASVALCGLVLLVKDSSRGATIVWPHAELRSKLIGSLVFVFLYSGLVPIIGFFTATMVFLIMLSRWWGGYRWWVAIIFGAIAAGVTALVFDVLLGVPLPRGKWF
jgi:putative tricarboxylic transport membrane protein